VTHTRPDGLPLGISTPGKGRRWVWGKRYQQFDDINAVNQCTPPNQTDFEEMPLRAYVILHQPDVEGQTDRLNAAG